MMTNQKPNSKPAGSVPTTWQKRTYDVWGNAKDGYEVNDIRSAGTVELRIPQTRNNVAYRCSDARCERRFVRVPYIGHCIGCTAPLVHDTGNPQEFVSAYPTNRQLKRAFGVMCQIETEGDDVEIEVVRKRDGYPIGGLHCVSHESLSPVRKAEGGAR